MDDDYNKTLDDCKVKFGPTPSFEGVPCYPQLTREDVVKAARSMLCTPFRHQGRLPGQALDCAGLIICVGRQLHIVAQDFDVPPYSRTPDGKTLLALCGRYLIRIPLGKMALGDVLVMIVDKEPQHLGIIGNYPHGENLLSIIHAVETYKMVIETRLVPSRGQRFVAAFRYPGVA